ncbi:thiol-disulfide oxidoreductase ResA [bacterium BMS3Bbin06]|nr:thiol-disulfide oxidoreductase ResA [bacterium BMS3Abin08]GBE34433.1 thiol-disulfide oxidoreductase ResA [bacterium BMS3Bbin06]HDO35771.1 TlpA family protein disulfide reductase [Nitrospirota bacterium]HDY70118.1 TlpA family protein disulfide reductase [Nitrospirota bacterium]
MRNLSNGGKFIVACFMFFITVEVLPSPWAIESLVDERAPGFTLRSLDGKEHSLFDFKGKVLILNFWASWCPPCRKEIPELQKLQGLYRGKKVAVVAVSTDRTLADVRAFLAKHPLTITVLHDSELKVWRKYKVFSLPTSFLIDGKGTIVKKFLGKTDWMSPEIKRQIDELLF